MPQNKKNRSKASTSLNQQRETEEQKVRMEKVPGGVSVKRGRGFGADPHYTKP